MNISLIIIILVLGTCFQGVISALWSTSRLYNNKYAPWVELKYFIPVIGIILLIKAFKRGEDK